MTHGAIHWSECVTQDVEAAKAHYTALAGWSFEGWPMAHGTYWVAMKDGRPVAGLMAPSDMKSERPIPPHWMTYVAVDDIDATVARAAETGGEVREPPFDVPGVGRVAMVADPGGAVAGFIQPAQG